jgi:hypothetical protein
MEDGESEITCCHVSRRKQRPQKADHEAFRCIGRYYKKQPATN